MQTPAFNLILADADGKDLSKMLELINAKLDLVQMKIEAITLLRHSKSALKSSRHHRR